jgi:hypothetical protein
MSAQLLLASLLTGAALAAMAGIPFGASGARLALEAR